MLGPVVILGLLELGARIALPEVSTQFFLRDTWQGEAVVRENPHFTRPFFGPGLERAPLPLLLPEVKPEGALRVFVLGESAAMGDPIPAFSFSRQLEVMLREVWQGRRVEVVNLGITAINSHLIRDIAREAVGLDPDVLLVYMGNNEVVGPYGPGTVFAPALRSSILTRLSIFLRRTRTYALMQQVGVWLRGGEEQRWRGMQMFLDRVVRYDDPGLTRMRKQIVLNLNAVTDPARERGIPVVLATPGANRREFAPLAGVGAREIGAATATAWTNKLVEAETDWAVGDLRGAWTAVEEAVALDADHADGQFLAGKIQLANGDQVNANEAFHLAVERDGLRFRPDRKMRALLLAHAENHAGVDVVDTAAQLDRIAPHGIAGGEFFYDHVHLTFEGHHQVAKAMFRALQNLGLAPPEAEPISAAACAEKLAWTALTELDAGEEMFLRKLAPPFSGQRNHATQVARDAETLRTLARSATPEVAQQTRECLVKAMAERENDWVVYGLAGDLGLRAGDFELSRRGYEMVAARFPEDAKAIGGLAAATLLTDGAVGQVIHEFESLSPRIRLRAWGEAMDQLMAAGRPDRVVAVDQALPAEALEGDAGLLVNLGVAYATEGHPDTARILFEDALGSDPGNARAMANLGVTFYKAGDQKKGLEWVRRAIATDPTNADSMIMGAEMISEQGDCDEALSLAIQAAALRPLDAALALSVASLAESCGAVSEAIIWWREVAERPGAGLMACRVARDDLLQHEAWEPALYLAQRCVESAGAESEDWRLLGVVYARQENFSQAEAAFREAVAQDPENPSALFALAQSLVQLGRVEESLPWYRKACLGRPDQVQWRRNLIWVLAELSRPETAIEAVHWAEELVSRPGATPLDAECMGIALAAAGEQASALEWLEKAFRELPDLERQKRLGDYLERFAPAPAPGGGMN